MRSSSAYSWFLQALNVMNAALELHRDSSVFAPLLSRAETELLGCDLVVSIVRKEQRGWAEDFVTIRLQDGAFVLIAHDRDATSVDWTVSEDYLRDVAIYPRRYIDHPGQLDFEWLKRRLGPTPRHGSAHPEEETKR